MLIKVVAVQTRLGEELGLSTRIHIFKQRPDFVCLPEYFLIDAEIHDQARAALACRDHLGYLRRLSEELGTCLIAGTVVEAEGDKLYNACYIMNRGLEIGRYRKRHPVPGEQAQGLSAGEKNLIIEIGGVRVAVMICGDVFYPEIFDELRAAKVDLIVIPTTSPLLTNDTITEKLRRDRKYFLSGAERSGAYVVKVCGIGQLFGKPLQGRSLIAAPWDVLARVDFRAEQSARSIVATLDIDEVRDFRAKQQRSKRQAKNR